MPSVRWHYLSEMTSKGRGIGNRKLPVNIKRDQRSNMEVDYLQQKYSLQWDKQITIVSVEWVVEKYGQHIFPHCGCWSAAFYHLMM